MKDRIDKMRIWIKQHDTHIAVAGVVALAGVMVALVRTDSNRTYEPQYYDYNEEVNELYLVEREMELQEMEELVAIERAELELMKENR